MSTQMGDVSLIKDEDVLKKMWQETEDFGQKKEIRSHMYKLREAKLRDFYNSGEVSSEIKRTTTETKTSNIPTIHADSLADHSFLSLKTKEIRDSESPTRDVSYRITDRAHDQGWNVVTTNEKSSDGKTHTTTRVASTAGSQKLDKGQLDYAAKSEQKASVYQDGDDKNYTKSVGAQSNTVIKQEAAGGDANSKFKSSSTKSTFSSNVVTESHSNSGDVIDNKSVPSNTEQLSNTIVRKTYTTDVPSELKKHPNYVDGNTKVIRETKTLPDGSTVTTTRYETTGKSSVQSSKAQHSTTSSEHRSSTVKTASESHQSNKFIVDVNNQRNINDNRTIDYVKEIKNIPEINVQITRNNVVDERQNVRSSNDEHVNVRVEKHSNVHRDSDIQSNVRQNVETYTQKMHSEKPNRVPLDDGSVTTTTKVVTTTRQEGDRSINQRSPTADQTTSTVTTTKTHNINERKIPVEDVESTNKKTTTITTRTYDINDDSVLPQKSPIDATNSKTTTITTKTHNVQDNRNTRNENFINVERQHEQDSRDICEIVIKPFDKKPVEYYPQSKREPSPEKRPKEPSAPYEQPERRQPIKPGKSELDKTPQPTEGQYDTTYRTEFTNKRISVDVNPTHDAFARSLRAVSPDRFSKCSSPSRGSVRSLRTSTTSLRSSTSPEKHPANDKRQPSRFSPERRPQDRSNSPKKSVDRFASNETVTYRRTPERKRDTSITTSTDRRASYTTDTVSRRNKIVDNKITTNKYDIDNSTLTTSKNRPRSFRSRSPSPTSTASDIEYIRNINDVVTDLDDENIEIIKKTTTKTDTRPTSLKITNTTTKRTKKVTERSPTSPLIDISTPRKSPTKETLPKEVPRKSSLKSPSKEPVSPFEKPPQYFSVSPTDTKPTTQRDRPKDRPLKRTDTYEERCRQILGISNDTTESRRDIIDQITYKKRDVTTKDTVTKQTKRSPQSPTKSSPDSKSSQKEIGIYPEQKTPRKESPKLNEFPSQVRKSPTKEPLEPYPKRQSPTKDVPKISEFPSQIKKTPQKEPFEPYPERKSPTKTAPSINEFPSQIKKSSQREPLGPYPEKRTPTKEAPSINEFPSQIRKSHQNETLEPYPERKSPTKVKPTIDEFPSQIRKSPQREPLEPYSHKNISSNEPSYINEFPSQTRRSPQKEPVEYYPEKRRPTKDKPSVSEFPSQIKRYPQMEPLEPYPDKKAPSKDKPSVSEFPSQIRKSPHREPSETYPEKRGPTKEPSLLCEFPSQTRKSPELLPLEPYPEKNKPSIDKTSISEFPSQIRKSPEREPSEPYPEKIRPSKGVAQSVSEFPSQTRKSPSKEPGGKYPIQTGGITSKAKYKKPRNTSSSSSTTSDEEEEIIRTSTYEETLEQRKPVVEPPFVKRNSYITTDSDVDEIDISKHKKDTISLIEQEIIQSDTIENRTVKKQLLPERKLPSDKPDKKFIENERIDTDITISKKHQPKSPSKPITQNKIDNTIRKKISTTTSTTTTAVKDIPREKSPQKKPTDTFTKKSKFIGETEYTDEYGKVRSTTKVVPKKPNHKNTLYDVDNFDKQDNTIHIRTKRIDDTVNKRNKVTQNGDITKRTTTVITTKTTDIPEYRKPLPRQENITKKTQTKLDDTKMRPSTRVPLSQKSENEITETTTRKTVVKTIPDINKPKSKPSNEIPKRHIVSTTITVTSKPKVPTNKTINNTVKSTVATKSTRTTQQKTKTPTKIQNGHVSSDTDEDSVIEDLENVCTTKKSTKQEILTRRTDNKITRTISDQIIKPQHKAPVRGASKPELIITSKPKPATVPIGKTPKPKLEKKCISTKSIIINNLDQEREIVVDLQRSKSSREPTPDRLCPLPITSEDDNTSPRYPDQITEPDDGTFTRKPKKLSDIPIMETSQTDEFTRITEITDNKRITEVDKVDETDESLLSVNKKISKFLDTAEQLTKTAEPSRKGPAPRVDRPKFQVDENLESDECLLSVSDKVTKFISTAEQLTTSQTLDRPKSPKCQNYPDVDDSTPSSPSVSDRVTKFTTTADKTPSDKSSTKPASKVPRPDISDVDETLKNDECLLSVTDKVTKFISTAEKLTTTDLKKPVSLSKINDKSRKDTEAISIEKEDTYTRKRNSVSPDKFSKSPEKTPDRRPSNTYTNIKETTSETKYSRRDSSPKLTDTTPKSTRRPSEEKPSKTVLSSVGRLRSTESIKKAKAIFENGNNDQEILRQRDILSRPSVFEGRKLHSSTKDIKDETKTFLSKTRLEFEDDNSPTKPRTTTSPSRTYTERDDTLKSTKLIRENAYTKRSSPERVPEIIETKHRSRSPSPDYSDLPGYMRPLDRSLRHNSPHHESVNQLHSKSPIPSKPDEPQGTPTKFGVTLRRTDSNKAVTGSTTTTTVTTTTERRKSGIALERTLSETDIEEIFDLEILEELLEKVTGYELRRKIRTQIRLVKKLISENRLTIYINSRTKHTVSTARESPKRETSPTKTKPRQPDVKKTTEYQDKYTRKTSPTRKPIDNKLYQHSDLLSRKDDTEKTSEYKSSYSYNERRTSSEVKSTRRSTSPETKLCRKSPEKQRSPTRLSPDRKSTTTSKTETTTKVFQTNLKKTSPNTTIKTVTDDKPIWVTQRTLKKTSDKPVSTKTTTSSSTVTSTRKDIKRASSPVKDKKPTDIITSSYGVGPTDENGSPLFGLKALRAQNKIETSKVQGTVIKSHYYAENGNEPVGEISVTKYSTDPRDLGSDEEIRENQGVTSVTTTQKFGYKDSPSFQSLSNKKKEICDIEDDSRTTTTKTTSKVTRRGSVKAISQKFIENAVESSKNERQTSYPKAGLILRTSSFKDTSSGDSREGSPGKEEMEKTVTVKTSSTRTVSGDTFLTNKSRVSGVQDVISRMKSEDIREGDSQEDIEARGLLNKFLGSQVILAGMEGHMTKSAPTKTTSSTSVVKKSATKVTTTSTEGGKTVTKTRTFQHPVSDEELDSVWDEQTLRLLLENSVDYEERRQIRARLRQVMAEQEACTELVEKASQEQSSGKLDEKVETTKRTFTKGPVTTSQVTTRVTSQQMSKKPISPFAKFRQLDKQNSLNTPPSTPKTPSGSGPLFKFTDPALSQSASTVKDRLLYWCKMKTKEYENIQLDNFSGSWADGLAFCALIHHFLPDAFDYHALTPKDRRHNFTLAFQVADEKADIAPLLDVDDMVATRRPDWKCVFTYVQSIYRRFKDED